MLVMSKGQKTTQRVDRWMLFKVTGLHLLLDFILGGMPYILAAAALLTLLEPAFSYDCDEGYCLPEPENFVPGVDRMPNTRTLSVSSVCGQNLDYRYVKFPDTGKSMIISWALYFDDKTQNVLLLYICM